MLYYPRTPLAAELADALQGKTQFSDAPNGLFLAAPRRTGKSTFLQADLLPELERAAWLWSMLTYGPTKSATLAA